MALKHQKYQYVQISPDKFIKIRVFKSRLEESNPPEAYLILNRWVRRVPRDAKTIKVEDLPVEIREKLGLKSEEKEETKK
ncbi:DUF5622 domain-containing protein [Stygiolobus caldivivus]|uniref:DUF5622 domain-containing protein n=1 Tax=Stygiolobus caldivivus TaxID=2824673 RepID=A0A8D5ZJ38_9CREN|nr:DUF5622 domain-containing protein [Stygiolobus caldivivus]BCU71159.1 hypothetical protein KN1_24560 [Stygiolobus caldivivus]